MAEPYKTFTCPNCGSDRVVREGASKFTCLSCGLTVTVGGGSGYAEKHVNEKGIGRSGVKEADKGAGRGAQRKSA